MRDKLFEEYKEKKSNDSGDQQEIITSLKASPRATEGIQKPVTSSLKSPNYWKMSTQYKKPTPKIGDRNLQWKKASELKIKKKQKEAKQKELEECTFKPLRITQTSKLAHPYEEAFIKKNTIHYYFEKDPEEQNATQ